MKVFDLSVVVHGSVRAENEEDAQEEFVMQVRDGSIDIPEPQIESCTEL